MRTTRIVRLGAFNIVTHPHETEDYKQLFLKAKNMHRSFKIRGDTHGVLGTAYQPDETSPYITGEVFTFLELDKAQEWFDIIKGEEATKDQTKEVNIPENLRPHLKRFRYAFFPKDHKFVYTISNGTHTQISPASMGDFLKGLLNDASLLAQMPFQEVDIRVIQDPGGIFNAFTTLRVSSLELTIKRPNPDCDDDDDSFAEEMEDQNISEYFIEQKSEKGKSLKPNDKTNKLIMEAAANGNVTVKGYDEHDLPRTVKSSGSPINEPFEFETKAPFLDFFIKSASVLLEKLKKLNK